MPGPLFFDHTRHRLAVVGLTETLDVLAFHGEEHLSQPFRYSVEFTSTALDLDDRQILGKPASFSLYPLPTRYPRLDHFLKPIPPEPLRTLNGVVTAFNRLGASRDEGRYSLTLEPRLALLSRSRQSCVYQYLSVPQIVEQVLRSRHGFAHQDFKWTLIREYPFREQVIQFDEDDLTFIQRLLADLGIWYFFSRHERLNIEVLEFRDDQQHYRPWAQVAVRPPAGLNSDGEDSLWNLQAHHTVASKEATVRAHDYKDIRADLDARVDRTRGDPPPTARPTTTANPTRPWATASPWTTSWSPRAATSTPASATKNSSTSEPA